MSELLYPQHNGTGRLGRQRFPLEPGQQLADRPRKPQPHVRHTPLGTELPKHHAGPHALFDAQSALEQLANEAEQAKDLRAACVIWRCLEQLGRRRPAHMPAYAPRGPRIPAPQATVTTPAPAAPVAAPAAPVAPAEAKKATPPAKAKAAAKGNVDETATLGVVAPFYRNAKTDEQRKALMVLAGEDKPDQVKKGEAKKILKT